MAQQQHVVDVHPDDMCPPNKRYDLTDANKKIDLEHVQCPLKSKILTNIIKNHPLRFSIAASSSVPWIYMAVFSHTLKEDGSKYRLKFMLDKKELSFTLDDFRTIFHLPQANDNNHDRFVPPPSISDMVPFYKNELGFTMEPKTSSSFKITEILCELIHYSLHHSTSSILYPRFKKIIIGHYMTHFPEISRRARDKYHNLKDDDVMKNIFNSWRYKDKVGMKIPDWMISKAMKHAEHYRMYVEVFGIDVPLTQSQPIESTQETYRTHSASRSTSLTPPTPVPTVDKADEMILHDTLQVSLTEHKSREEQEDRENVELVNEHLASVEIEKMVEGQENVIDDSSISRNDEHNILGTRLEPMSDNESPEVEFTNVVIPVNVNEEEEEITDEVYELKRREKGKIVEESRNTLFPTPIRSPMIYTDLVSSDTKKLQELTVSDTKSTPSSSSPSTKLSTTNRLLSLFKAKPARFKRYKSFFQELHGRYGYLFEHLRARFMPKKSFTTLANHLQEVMADSLPTMVEKHVKEQVQKQVSEQVRDQVPVYVAEGLILERQKNKEEMEKKIAKVILQERGNIQTQISLQIQKAIANDIPSQVDASVRSYLSGHIFQVHPAQSQTIAVPEQQYQLYLSMKDDPQLQQQYIAIWLALQMKCGILQVPWTTCRISVVRLRDQDDPHDDAHLEEENSTESYASDDDEIPTKQVSQDIMEEVSLTIDEAKLKKIADEMLR
nr:hypothetical protein [Tanacetum cinerariifolium]